MLQLRGRRLLPRRHAPALLAALAALPLPAIVFNLFEQFEALGDAYEPMVKANRARDVLYQGQVNPTVARWADVWESIQFSGRENGAEWKCPFRGKR
ncbi:MAG: YqcI/YcgG family protein [Elusimicrobiota bacterium]|nr:MAG: YqcI/YcgG family protein [Elusimicrobiota bacterium]